VYSFTGWGDHETASEFFRLRAGQTLAAFMFLDGPRINRIIQAFGCFVARRAVRSLTGLGGTGSSDEEKTARPTRRRLRTD